MKLSLDEEASLLLERCQKIGDVVEGMLALGAEEAKIRMSSKLNNCTGQDGLINGIMVNGIGKLKTLIKAEERFLQRLLKESNSILPCHVMCSNVPYFEALILVATTEPGVVSILENLEIAKGDRHGKQSARIDIISHFGRKWIKLKASGLKGFKVDLQNEQLADASDDDFEDESNQENQSGNVCDSARHSDSGMAILQRQIRQLAMVLQQYPVHFVAPTLAIRFVVSDRIYSSSSSSQTKTSHFVEDNDDVLRSFSSCGAILEIQGAWNAGYTSLEFTSEGMMVCHLQKPITNRDDFQEHFILPDILNLDVTTLIALASHLTNNFDEIKVDQLKHGPLVLQAKVEDRNPLLRDLLQVFQMGKSGSWRKLVATQSAVQKFFEIAMSIAGPEEKRRCVALFRDSKVRPETVAPQAFDLIQERIDHDEKSPFPFSVEIIPDSPSNRFRLLLETQSNRPKWLTDQVLLIFGTGDRIKATTVTANRTAARTLQIGAVFSNSSENLGNLHSSYLDSIPRNSSAIASARVVINSGCSVWIHEPRSFIERKVKN